MVQVSRSEVTPLCVEYFESLCVETQIKSSLMYSNTFGSGIGFLAAMDTERLYFHSAIPMCIWGEECRRGSVLTVLHRRWACFHCTCSSLDAHTPSHFSGESFSARWQISTATNCDTLVGATQARACTA